MNESLNKKVAVSESRVGIETPMVISHIAQNCLYTGFFGRLDSVRIKSITDKVIERAESSGTLITIVDLSNVEYIDSAICQHLIDIAITMKLLGVEVVFCGLKAIVAQTMTKAGIYFNEFGVYKNLEIALQEVYRKTGFKLVKVDE